MQIILKWICYWIEWKGRPCDIYLEKYIDILILVDIPLFTSDKVNCDVMINILASYNCSHWEVPLTQLPHWPVSIRGLSSVLWLEDPLVNIVPAEDIHLTNPLCHCTARIFLQSNISWDLTISSTAWSTLLGFICFIKY